MRDSPRCLSTERHAQFNPSMMEKMPTELILEVFKLMESCEDLAALVGTSKLFYTVWQSYSKLIIEVTMPLMIANITTVCIADATLIVETQLEIEMERVHASRPNASPIEESYHSHHFDRLRLYRANAAQANAVCDFITHHDSGLRKGLHCDNPRCKETQLHELDLHERIRITHSFYVFKYTALMETHDSSEFSYAQPLFDDKVEHMLGDVATFMVNMDLDKLDAMGMPRKARGKRHRYQFGALRSYDWEVLSMYEDRTDMAMIASIVKPEYHDGYCFICYGETLWDPEGEIPGELEW